MAVNRLIPPVNSYDEQSKSIRFYRLDSAAQPGSTVQIIRKCRIQTHGISWSEQIERQRNGTSSVESADALGGRIYSYWADDLDNENPDLEGGVQTAYQFPSDTRHGRRRYSRWSDVVYFDGELVQVETARRVLDILGHLDNPDFEPGRGLELPKGFWRALEAAPIL
jgi:hypothetical protein